MTWQHKTLGMDSRTPGSAGRLMPLLSTPLALWNYRAPGSLLKATAEAQVGKPYSVSTFKASARITSASIPLAKTSQKAKPNINGMRSTLCS